MRGFQMSREEEGEVKKIAGSVGGQTEAFGWLQPGKAVGANNGFYLPTYRTRSVRRSAPVAIFKQGIFIPEFQTG